MLGSALYYPHIDIHDPMWLRSAILFWDEIQTIVPSAIASPYEKEDTRICFEEGYLKPLRCDMHAQIIDDLGNQIIGSLNWRKRHLWHNSISANEAFRDLGTMRGYEFDIEETLHEAGLHPEKLSPELRGLALRLGLARMHRGKISPHVRQFFRDFERIRMHPEKMSYFLRDLLEEDNFLNGSDSDWLMVDGAFAAAYMSALATRLSKQVDLAPLTSYADAQASSFQFMFDDVVDDSPNNATGAILGVIMRGIRVDSSVDVARIIKFRRNRADQYAEFAGQISELKSQIENSAGDGKQAHAQAKILYEKKIEPSLRALKRELDDQAISSIWEGAYRALTISVPSAGALAYFTGLAGAALLGAGAALAATDIGVRGYLAGRKIRAGNPYSYLHDINSSFGLPKFAD